MLLRLLLRLLLTPLLAVMATKNEAPLVAMKFFLGEILAQDPSLQTLGYHRFIATDADDDDAGANATTGDANAASHDVATAAKYAVNAAANADANAANGDADGRCECPCE